MQILLNTADLRAFYPLNDISLKQLPDLTFKLVFLHITTQSQRGFSSCHWKGAALPHHPLFAFAVLKV